MAKLTSILNSLANHACLVSPAGHRRCGPRKVCLVAHRGAHRLNGVVENTLAAFDPCLEAGIWGLELDIRWTQDGEPVVHHDPDCGRTFMRPDIIIEQTRFAALQQAVPELPSLAEVVRRYGRHMHLMIEVKQDVRQQPALIARLMAVLEPLQPICDYHLLSLIPEQLEAFSEVPRAAMVDVAWLNEGEMIKRNRALEHGGIGGSFVLLHTWRLRKLQQAGCQVGTGFVESPAALRREIHRGVDWIFSDNALALQAVLERERGEA